MICYLEFFFHYNKPRLSTNFSSKNFRWKKFFYLISQSKASEMRNQLGPIIQWFFDGKLKKFVIFLHKLNEIKKQENYFLNSFFPCHTVRRVLLWMFEPSLIKKTTKSDDRLEIHFYNDSKISSFMFFREFHLNFSKGQDFGWIY